MKKMIKKHVLVSIMLTLVLALLPVSSVYADDGQAPVTEEPVVVEVVEEAPIEEPQTQGEAGEPAEGDPALPAEGAGSSEPVIVVDPVPPVETVVDEPAVNNDPVQPAEGEPTVEPGDDPIVEPGEEPVVEPGEEPGDEPVVEPGDDPIVEPGEEPIVEPGEKPGDEPVEEETEEFTSPALTLSQEVNGVLITLYAPENSLEEDTQLRVVPVTAQEIFAAVEGEMEAEGLVLTDIVAFDITPVDPEGNERQPRIPVTVTFSGTGLFAEEDASINVYRVSDDASSVTEMATDVATTDVQEFTTDHFTIYVIGSGSPQDPNGDGSGPNTPDNPYVLNYGSTIRLGSDQSGLLINEWVVSSGAEYVIFNNRQVENINESKAEQLITVRHRYSTILGVRTEYYYIIVKPQVLTVEFKLQDAGADSFATVSTINLYHGETATAPDLPATKEVDGKTYTLYSWYTSEGCETVASLDNITENKVFYARYTSPAVIHYIKNTTDAATVPADQEAGIGNLVVLGGASYAGHSLASWNTAADGSGDSYNEGASIPMPEGGLVLYAQWNTEKLVMRYYYNYGGSPGHFRSVTNIPKNDRTTLLTDIPARPGDYIFLGWSTTPGGRPEYFPGSTYYTGTEDVDLYAKWGTVSKFGPITAKGTTITYDGQTHTIEGVEEGESDKYPGFVYIGTDDYVLFTVDFYARITNIKAIGTNVGSYATPIYAEVYGEYPIWLGGFGPAGEYVKVNNNVLRINPVELTLVTNTDEKEYDGEALTSGGKVTFGENSSEFTYDGTAVTLVNGETLNIRSTGSQTEIGESENGFELDWGKPEWGSAASTAIKYNYKFVETELGKLTVTEHVDPEPTPTPTPTPSGDEPTDGPTNPTTPSQGRITPNVPVDPEPEVEPEDIIDEDVPSTEPETLPDDETPAVEPEKDSHLAIVNVLTVLGSLAAAFAALTSKSDKKGLKWAGLVPGIGSVVALLLTEDLAGKLTAIDKWTPLMAIICVAGAAIAYFARKKD